MIRGFFNIVAVALLLVACEKQPQQSTGVSLHSELGGTATGFERACGARSFNFPEDHGAHPSFRNEWWYITGNVQDSSGQRFGFHVTFFRIANELPTQLTEKQTSSWHSNEFYMAHFAVTQKTREIKKFERFARAAAGLAGAEITPNEKDIVKVWLDDWQLYARQNTQGTGLQWHLSLETSDTKLNLALAPQKPIVLQGDSGYSQKSADPCNASYYYSLTRLETTGAIEVDGKTHSVNGHAWLDREWSSSALGADQTGWDWFAIQLDDGRDIMLYQLRRNDRSRDPYSHAVEIDKQGNSQEIPIQNVEITTTRWWQSAAGNRYPVSGKILLKETGEELIFEPLTDNQELDFTVRYWEGAINITNSAGEQKGRGYMELTGY